jgi:hypothetical protein
VLCLSLFVIFHAIEHNLRVRKCICGRLESERQGDVLIRPCHRGITAAISHVREIENAGLAVFLPTATKACHNVINKLGVKRQIAHIEGYRASDCAEARIDAGNRLRSDIQ